MYFFGVCSGLLGFAGVLKNWSGCPVLFRSRDENLGVGGEAEMKKPQPEMAGAESTLLFLG